MKGYRDLKVWMKGMDLAAEVYRLAKLMPREERYRITAQMLRSGFPVPANVAEGYQRGTRRDYAHFISIARGSLAEAETFVLLARKVGFLTGEDTEPALIMADELSRMLYALRRELVRPEAGRDQQ